jgi:hypothetical protein
MLVRVEFANVTNMHHSLQECSGGLTQCVTCLATEMERETHW